MRRTRQLVTLVIALLAVVVLAALVFRSGPRPITEEDVNRVENGMSRSEVEAILGPPRDQTTGPLVYRLDDDPFVCGLSPPIVELVDRPQQHFTRDSESYRGLDRPCWCSDSLVFTVAFRDSRACETTVYHTRRLPQSLLENAIWRLKRQWRRWFAD